MKVIVGSDNWCAKLQCGCGVLLIAESEDLQAEFSYGSDHCERLYVECPECKQRLTSGPVPEKLKQRVVAKAIQAKRDAEAAFYAAIRQDL